ncbi:uncharacterized protein LOC111895449 isoform X1 [Lactuca sativa]|uniref:uncharacterized protein LOC111895449 isoform X1 n=1 Tax=Lactuca sativa TaxID=4236 RepID=UPI000CD8BD86|nr:uncharacterized protein LOC111895449 isoform X1 [Lactuca sativa]
MITERKNMRKTALSSVDGGGKNIGAGVEAVKTTDSVDHWDFLDQIEAPMWADLSICDLTNDESNDSWFDIIHQFHQCSSSQLLSTIFHPNSITIQEPPSPKLPPSVSKSRGKNYKTKAWGQRNNLTISNKQHPVKTLTMKSSRTTGSSNNTKPNSIKTPKVSSSCESGVTNNTSRPKLSKPKPSLCSFSSQEQEKEGSAMSSVTSNRNEHHEKKGLEVSKSNQSSEFLTSLRNNLRRSCATRPAVRVVRCSEGGLKSSSRKSSVASSSSSSLNQCKDAQNKPRVLNVTKEAPAQNVRNLTKSNKQGSISNILASKLQVQQNQMIGKEAEKRFGIKKVASTKIVTCQKGIISRDKGAQSTGNVQKNGSKKLISLKEKTNTQNRDKDTSRKVYFR